MYDRRWGLYREVIDFLYLVLRDFNPEISDVTAFQRATAEADFLFGTEITDYIDKVVKQAMKSRTAHLQYKDSTQVPPPDYDPVRVAAGMHELSEWLISQPDNARRIFKPYLDVSQIK